MDLAEAHHLGSVVEAASPALRSSQRAQAPHTLSCAPQKCSWLSGCVLRDARHLALLVDAVGVADRAAERTEIANGELLRHCHRRGRGRGVLDGSAGWVESSQAARLARSQTPHTVRFMKDLRAESGGMLELVTARAY